MDKKLEDTEPMCSSVKEGIHSKSPVLQDMSIFQCLAICWNDSEVYPQYFSRHFNVKMIDRLHTYSQHAALVRTRRI